MASISSKTKNVFKAILRTFSIIVLPIGTFMGVPILLVLPDFALHPSSYGGDFAPIIGGALEVLFFFILPLLVIIFLQLEPPAGSQKRFIPSLKLAGGLM